MKKLFLILMVLSATSFCKGQSNVYDTAFIRNMSLKGKEWMIFFSKTSIKNYDSTWKSKYTKLENKVIAAAIAFGGTREQKLEADLVIDTFPELFAEEHYKIMATTLSNGMGTVNGTNWRTKYNNVTHTLFVLWRTDYNIIVTKDYDAIVREGILDTIDKPKQQ
jgi:hypothetical protein